MVYDVLLERRNGTYVATVASLPAVTVTAPTREAALVDVRSALERRLSGVEVVPMEVPDRPAPYPPEVMDLAAKAARLRGEPGAPITGKPWIDLAGFLADVPEEDWAIYEAEIARARQDPSGEDPAANRNVS